MGDKDTQLPADIITDIKAKATKYSRDISQFAAYTAGATEYAIKPQQEQENNKQLIRVLLETEQAKRDELKQLLNQENDKSRALLEKFISRHEAGLLPDRLLYNEIKTFLDGTK